MSNINPLADIQIANVKKLMEYNNENYSELASRAGLNGSTIRASFGNAKIHQAPSEKTLEAIARYYKLWVGELDKRGFDPETGAPPDINMTVTLQIKDVSAEQAHKIKTTMLRLGRLLS